MRPAVLLGGNDFDQLCAGGDELADLLTGACDGMVCVLPQVVAVSVEPIDGLAALAGRRAGCQGVA
jgi:hypothetical protein